MSDTGEVLRGLVNELMAEKTMVMDRVMKAGDFSAAILDGKLNGLEFAIDLIEKKRREVRA